MTAHGGAATCTHPAQREGYCPECGACEHDVILNGACLACGTTELDPVERSPKKPLDLVPASRLTRRPGS